ncbi:MAG: S8 family serine peptidase [Steroidobacteraceae bacterium]
MLKSRWHSLWILALLIAPAAHAQIRALPLPGLPGVGLPPAVTGTLNGLPASVQSSSLTDVRALRVRELLRTHRAQLEADPDGNPIVRAQIVAFSPAPEVLDRARALGFTVLREQTVQALDARIVVLRTPRGSDTRRALRQLRAADPAGTYDFDHIYLESGTGPEQTVQADTSRASAPAIGSSVRIGLVDGGVDATHVVFRNVDIERNGCDGKVFASAHGTAIASLLVGKSVLFNGVMPGAQLFAADVYCGLATGGAVDAVVDAIAWLTQQTVPVINVSLVGPPNLMLERIVKLAVAHGYLIVAAVGNDGPAARPLYPAAYPGVVGVTAVDAHRKVLLEAVRGPQVSFAAPGADMAAASLSNSFTAVRGTSFAAPIVAGMLAQSLHAPDTQAASEAIESLAQQAIDLGARGSDPIYGRGLVGEQFRIIPSKALLSKQAALAAN